MLSKVGFITIFALALVAPAAMAFDATFSVDSVSSSSEHNAEYARPIVVTLHFMEKVDGTATELTILVENRYGGQTPVTAPDIIAKDIDPHTAGLQNDSQTFVFTIPGGATAADAVRVHLHVAAGLPDLNPGSNLTSNAGALTINLVGPDPAASVPTVIRIETTPTLLIPADGYTGDAFDVVITLSEQPKAFTKDHVDVDKGTAGDLVYLGAVEPPSGETATGRSGNYHRFLVRITPKAEDGDLVIRIKSFEDQEKPIPNKYISPVSNFARVEERDILTIKLKEATADALGDKTEGENRIAPTVPTPTLTKVQVETTPTATDTTEKTKVEAIDTSVLIPEEGRVYISEIMFAGGGFLPQWIEITNGSRTEQVNLSGWTLTVKNATADENVFVSEKAKFRIPEGMRIDPSGQHDTPSTLLVVAKRGRTNLDGRMAAGQVVNMDITRPRHALLSTTAFKITLSPPGRSIVPEQATARAAATDVVGNLADDGTAAWPLPMNEGGARSSMIRRHVSAEPKDGEMMDTWVLASETAPTQPKRLGTYSYYGFPTDVGTPGFRAGGAVPVELSHFHPERQKDTGAVVITWSTQSELNNAGFFIRRSQRRDGRFKIINATMVPGAGTTSEKRFYSYADTTAQPDVVYYYQIADVSLDGDRRTLTRGVRLRGHIGAAGKEVSTWGELKTHK